MSKRKELRRKLNELDRHEEMIKEIEITLENMQLDELYIWTGKISFHYQGYEDDIKSMLEKELSDLKGKKSVLEIELGVDE